jgi:hypothetical protein
LASSTPIKNAKRCDSPRREKGSEQKALNIALGLNDAKGLLTLKQKKPGTMHNVKSSCHFPASHYGLT